MHRNILTKDIVTSTVNFFSEQIDNEDKYLFSKTPTASVVLSTESSGNYTFTLVSNIYRLYDFNDSTIYVGDVTFLNNKTYNNLEEEGYATSIGTAYTPKGQLSFTGAWKYSDQTPFPSINIRSPAYSAFGDYSIYNRIMVERNTYDTQWRVLKIKYNSE